MSLRQERNGEDRIIRSLYVNKEVWHAAIAKAKAEGTNLSLVIRNALKAYLAQKDPGE